MSIELLPAEAVLEITIHVTTQDIAALRLTNRHLSNVLSREIFYSVLRRRHPTPCQQALFEAACRDDRDLIRQLIHRGILEITGRTNHPLIQQAIYEFHSAETIRTLLVCLAERRGVGGAIEEAQRMRRQSVVEALNRYFS
ncbi:hypothetical protein HOY82DRAFT_604933 [Tuber indicum]|nr:hypothetical protein HOY82DRAFT_604933 [Tuber indicum]